ncbi:ribosomal L1 domain-containing protein 1-like [Hibiscus syriacus]|uniref:Ribosomal L1 domain-containing protein 1-like n=1 Tax=Hibiscus syriacus TaxID=106335 RepID=A0A6A2WCC8_HIBSY|nr:ribosomal L1 domain-containing protein 1-like [Hibiscus syriacus]
MAVEMNNFLPLILFCIAAIISSTVFFQRKKCGYTTKRKLPPGQLGLPFIGETMEFYEAQRINRLFEDFVELRVAKYGKIFKTSLMGLPTIGVNGAKANRFILSNKFKLVISTWPSSSVQLMGRNSIMEKHGDQHRFRRSLITSSLSCSALQSLVPKICRAVQLHLKSYWHGKENVILYCSTKLLTFTSVRVLVGDQCGARDVGDQCGARDVGKFRESSVRCSCSTDQHPWIWIFKGEESKGDNSEDVGESEHDDVMKTKKEGEELTLENVKKMEYSWEAARESMRLFPPIFGSFRKAVADIEYQGFTIPKGWKVLWTAYGTHYDGECFKNPRRYDPSRFQEFVPPYVYVPFGGGPRSCAGYQLAKFNILIFLHYVVTGYDWSLVHPQESIIMYPLPLPSQGIPIYISPKTPK